MMRKKRGFSLVELLVVIGIIAVIMAILAPALGRAREQAKKTACMSNLRQLAFAFLQYAQDNRGWFPNAANGTHSETDWIFWQPSRDQNEGMLVKYLGKQFDPRHYRCPSDEVDQHPGPNAYPYSYTMNARIGGAHNSPTTYYPQFHPVRMHYIIRPARKILIIDEAWTGIDDGAWATFSLDGSSGHTHNVLSNRHDKRAETITDPEAGFGNVIFADCHADWVPRKWCLLPEHSDPRSQ